MSDILISEGNYVSTGTVLFKVASFNALWVEAQVYLPYLSFVNNKTEATFSIPALGAKTYKGKLFLLIHKYKRQKDLSWQDSKLQM
ncbi:MAG: efflux RND transporter periplasmic adaptor subunit [Bacteroidetes bacterium]|nr:efflux RND transporter periplasmic adaptor subunit [Bacteroidota bacterium]